MRSFWCSSFHICCSSSSSSSISDGVLRHSRNECRVAKLCRKEPDVGVERNGCSNPIHPTDQCKLAGALTWSATKQQLKSDFSAFQHSLKSAFPRINFFFHTLAQVMSSTGNSAKNNDNVISFVPQLYTWVLCCCMNLFVPILYRCYFWLFSEKKQMARYHVCELSRLRSVLFLIKFMWVRIPAFHRRTHWLPLIFFLF